jgi:hypothetical protein
VKVLSELKINLPKTGEDGAERRRGGGATGSRRGGSGRRRACGLALHRCHRVREFEAQPLPHCAGIACRASEPPAPQPAAGPARGGGCFPSQQGGARALAAAAGAHFWAAVPPIGRVRGGRARGWRTLAGAGAADPCSALGAVWRASAAAHACRASCNLVEHDEIAICRRCIPRACALLVALLEGGAPLLTTAGSVG